MIIPRSLIVVLTLLVLTFLSSLIGAARARAREFKYQKIPYVVKSERFSTSPPNSGASYQQPAQDHYALPAKQKEVTYCVIDGRLVDS